MKGESLVRFARAYCAQQLPWFAPALFRCRIQLTEKVSVAAVDQHFNIYFNPKVIQAIEKDNDLNDSLAEIGFIWIHEISHLLREHGDRAKERSADPEWWNVAADLEINDSNWPGLEMPEEFPGVLPKDFGLRNGQLTEHYYQVLLAREKKRKPSSGSKNNSPADRPDEGSGVHGQERPWEVKQTDAAQQLDEIEVEMVRRSVAQEMKDSKDRGSMPGGWERWVEEKLQARIDWRQVLRHRMSVAINQGVGSRIDYSFRRPSRRQSVYQPILPPSLSGDLSARIACVVDTSGSMSAQQLNRVVAEVCSVLRAFRVPVTIIPCDARAYEPIKVASPSDYFKLKKLKGGGGTNMIAGIEAALKLKPKPDSVLVLTDGYTPFPPKLYKTPVIFGIFKMNTHYPIPLPPNPPWKRDTVVEIEQLE